MGTIGSHPGRRKPIDDLSNGAIEVLTWIRRTKRMRIKNYCADEICPDVLELEAEGHISVEPDPDDPGRCTIAEL